MSHTLKITDLRLSTESVVRAADYLKLKTAAQHTEQFFDRTTAKGSAVWLPGWARPVVIESSGALIYDNFNGAWGDSAELGKLVAFATAAECDADLGSIVLEKVQGGFVATVEVG